MESAVTAIFVAATIAIVGWIGQMFYLSIWGTAKIVNAVAEIKADTTAAITNHKKEVAQSFEAQQRMVGETISAVRQKINDVELYVRDHFVRSDEFSKGMESLTLAMNRLDDSIGAQLIRMENKIDDAVRAQTP